MSSRRKRNLIGWVVLSVFLGGILWLAKEPVLGLLVGGVVFALSFFYDLSRGKYVGVIDEEEEEAWKETVTQLLRGESKFRFNAQVEHRGAAWRYRDAFCARVVLPEIGNTAFPPKEKPELGLEPLFSCYFLLQMMPTQGCTSYHLGEIDERIKQEAEKYMTTWWELWKQTWWSQVPSYLRKTLLSAFERR